MVRFLEDVTVATDEELWAPAMWTDIGETVASVASQCDLSSDSTLSQVRSFASHDSFAPASATFVTPLSIDLHCYSIDSAIPRVVTSPW